jgi:[acyl-carrier-protein] S-malonyltransferase
MKIAMIFPGYTSQYVGMAKDLYDEYRVIQEYFEEAYNCLNLNFIKLCFASSDSELSKPINANSSIFLVSASLVKLLEASSIKPDIVAGYGIGHYSAIFAASGLTFPDGLYLVKKYSSFLEEYLPLIEADVLKVDGISSLKLKNLLKNFNNVVIASYNTDIQHIISGKTEDIELVKEHLKTLKIKSIKVNRDIGFNSELMNEITQQFKLYLEKVDFKDINQPVINTIDGKEIISGKKLKEFIIKQINLPLKWTKVIDRLKDVDLVIEIGPGNSLSDHIKLKFPEKKVMSFNNKSDLEEIKQFIESKNESIQIVPEIKIEEINV